MSPQVCFGGTIIINFLFTIFTYANECFEPENLQAILVERIKEVYHHQNFLRTRDFLPSSGLDMREERGSESRSTILRHQNNTCSAMLKFDQIGQDVGLNQISTCPWILNLNIDPDRIPQYIPEAECSCKHCVHYDGKCSRTKGRPCYAKRGLCKRVFSSKVVVRRHCKEEKGVYEYTSGLLPVAIGCTCSRDFVVHNKQ